MHFLRIQSFLLTVLLLLGGLTAHAATLYWVGGAGNWSDISHWSTSSGGSPNVTTAPTPTDDVIFDGQSFSALNQIVVMNLDTGTCRNFDWQGVAFTPAFEMEGKLFVYGSFSLDPGMQFFGAQLANNVELRMEALSGTQNIDFAGVRYGIGVSWAYLKMVVAGEATFNLLDDIDLGDNSADFYHAGGILMLNSHKIFSKTITMAGVTPGDFLDLGTGGLVCEWLIMQASQPMIDADEGSISVMNLTAGSFAVRRLTLTAYGVGSNAAVQLQGSSDTIFVDTLIVKDASQVSMANIVVGEHTQIRNGIAGISFDFLHTIGTLDIQSSANAPLTMGSASDPNMHVLRRDQDTVCLEFVSAGHINATGSAVWVLTATSTDLGNNQGNFQSGACPGSVGLEEEEALGNAIYPTLVAPGQTMYLTRSKPMSGRLAIIDFSGKEVFSFDLPKQTQFSFTIPSLAAGLYFVAIRSEKDAFVKKIRVLE